jgi:hypothetical protein
MIPVTRHASYLRQRVPVRLGSLAADLARIASFAEILDSAAVESLLEESTAFIEWCVPDLINEQVEQAARLVDIQRGLGIWRGLWQKAQTESERRKLISQAQAWSDEVLQMSGLLDSA